MKPYPLLTTVFVEKDAKGIPLLGEGMLSPHGTVRFQRRTGRLDRFTDGNTFKLIINAHYVNDWLDSKVSQLLRMLNIEIVSIADKKEAKDHEIADTQEQILPFMKSLDVNALLVRPDQYLFGTASNNKELVELLDQLQKQAEEFNLDLVT